MLPVVTIIRWNCICDHGCCFYKQYDVMIEVSPTVVRCDSFREAREKATEILKTDIFKLVFKEGGDLPQERY